MKDLRFACRQLLNSPGFTTVVVLTLALGIGANTAMFSIVRGVLLEPLPFPEPDRIAMVWESSPEVDRVRVAPGNFLDWQKQNTSFEAMGCMAAWAGSREFNLVETDGTLSIPGAYVSSGYFAALGVPASLGRWFRPEEDQRDQSAVAILSHRLWKDRFGADTGILGKTLTLDSFWRREFTIVGVMPPDFQLPTGELLWVSAGWMLGGTPRRDTGHFEVIARLKPGVTAERAQAEMNLIQARIREGQPGANIRPRTRVAPLREEWLGDARRPLLVLSGAVLLILLIACANVANLLLARASSRRAEVSLRFVLGASRLRVLRQLLTESLVLALLGGAAGLAFASWGIKVFIALNPSGLSRLSEVTVSGSALLFTGVVAVATGLLFGLAPAWQSARTQVNESLQHASRGSSTGPTARRLRAALVSTEVALATVLLVGAGLMLQSLGRLTSLDRGIRPAQLVTASLDFSVAGYTTWVTNSPTRPQIRLQQLIERIRSLPGVESVSAASHFFRQDNRPALQTFAIFGQSPRQASERPTTDNKAITPDYLRTVGMRLIRGRNFKDTDSLGAPGVVLVNESFVRRYLPDENPIGKHLTLARELAPLDARDNVGLPLWSEIIGVVSDVRSFTTRPEAVPEVYWSSWQWPMQKPTLFVRTTENPNALMASLHRETRAIAPNLPAPRVALMAEHIGASLAQPRFQAWLLNLFGGIALTLAGCGVYGILAYNVSLSRREIGIRIALGAPQRGVIAMVLKRGMSLVLAGLVAGLLASLAAAQLLRNLLFEIQPTDPWTFLGVALLLSSVAGLACWIPARRAADVDPMVALRTD